MQQSGNIMNRQFELYVHALQQFDYMTNMLYTYCTYAVHDVYMVLAKCVS